MAKYKSGNYYQANKVISDERFEELPYQSVYIYLILQELEHRFTGIDEDFFYRSDAALAEDCKMPLSTFKKYKGILVKKNSEFDKPLFQTWQMHFRDTKTKRKSNKHITAYRLYSFE